MHGRLYKTLIQSREWRELRAQVLREHPVCQWCEREGRVSMSRECHHIVEAESGRNEAEVRDLMFRRSNIVALCHACHARYHKEQRYHSTAKVKQRQEERKAQWRDEMTKRFGKTTADIVVVLVLGGLTAIIL